MKANTSYLGIDTGKSKLHLAAPDRFLGEFDNSAEGRRLLVKTVAASKPTLVVIEASGGYERPITETLQEDGR